jgi:hypothetical protein
VKSYRTSCETPAEEYLEKDFDGMSTLSKSISLFLFLIAFSLLALAQQPPSPKPATPETEKTGAGSEKNKEIEKKEQSQRALVVPMFGVTNRQDAPPLKPREKFRLFAKSAFDPVTLGLVGLQAAWSQAENQFPAYGQGAQGYGKRYGAALADEVSSSLFSNFFYPTLLKQDPRYFRLGEGTFKKRFFYSVKQEFICHTDKGGRSFNFSNVLGAFTAGAISNLYYPGNTLIRTIPATATSPAIPVYHNDRGVGLTISRATIAIGYGTMGGLLDEFWPDILQKLHKPKKADGMPASSSNH